MNDYIKLSCGLMLLFMIIGQAYEVSKLQTPDSGSYSFNSQSGTWTVNGTDTTYDIGENNLILGISVEQGIMIAVIAIVALITLVGASGLTFDISETAERAIVNFAIFGAFWGIFSVLMYGLLIDVYLGLGWVVYFIISIIHLFGILKIVYK